MKTYDVIIVGAGPGGLAAARILGEAGKNILLLEKNESIGPKICAGGITLKDLHLGIPHNLEGRTYSEMAVYSPSGRKTVIRQERPFLRTTARETLGQWMAEQLKGFSVEVRTRTRVVTLDESSIVTAEGERLGFHALLGADGSLSTIRRLLGVPTRRVMPAIQYNVPDHYDDIAFFLDSDLFGAGYAWIFPHAAYTSIGCGAVSSTLSGPSLKDRFHAWIDKRHLSVGGAQLEGWTINFDYRGHEFGKVFLIGDAAGFTSGLTGEGIYFAMVSGEEVAKKILNPAYQTPHIRRLLSIKRTHERLLRALESGKRMRRFLHELAVLSTRNSWVASQALARFG